MRKLEYSRRQAVLQLKRCGHPKRVYGAPPPAILARSRRYPSAASGWPGCDDPYSKAPFKTAKYRPDFPARSGCAERLRVFPSCPLITSKHARSSLQMLAIARAMAVLCAKIGRVVTRRSDALEKLSASEDARAHCHAFFTWYSTMHRHSGIGCMAAHSVHQDRAEQWAGVRQAMLDAAFRATPKSSRDHGSVDQLTTIGGHQSEFTTPCAANS